MKGLRSTGILFSVIILIVGCDRSKPTESKTTWIDPKELKPGPIQHAKLSDDQMKRIERVQNIFNEVDPSPLDKWVEDFRRDINPENELKIWENMASVFATFTASRDLSLDAKKEVFQVVLMRSGAPDTEVTKHLKLKVLTEGDAKEVMALFAGQPEPIKVLKQ